jgi:hypothetical protein
MRTLLAVLLLAAPAAAMEVTVYNSDLGLVKEVRPFTLNNGLTRLEVADVAARIDPTSVHFKSLTAPDAVAVLEQDFQYDLVSQEKLLERYLGREVELVRYGQDGARKDSVKGTLLSSSGGRVLKVGDRVLLNPGGEFVLPELPEGLRSRPTLVWQLKSSKAGEHQGEISYLTGGLSWSADYVLVVDKDDAKGDLNAWVTVVNGSGATYKDAKLKLVAGDVHRAPVPASPMRYKTLAAVRGASMEMDANMAEKSFFEYHLYTLARPTTLADNSSKQVEMASAAGVPVKKLFVYDGVQGVQWTEFYGDAYSDPGYGLSSGKKVSVFFELQNKKSEGLGLPLPKGRVRVYKKDDDGSLQLAGEDAIDHTPKDEKVRVKMGEAFDVVGERKRTSFQSGKRWLEESFELRVRNHKDADIAVTVVEHLYRWTGWKLTESSSKYEKKDAQTIEFPVTVKKDSEAVVTYTVRYSW